MSSTNCISLASGRNRVDQRPGHGQIGMGCPRNPWSRTIQVSWADGWVSVLAHVRAKIFCDWVSREIESLKSRTEKWEIFSMNCLLFPCTPFVSIDSNICVSCYYQTTNFKIWSAHPWETMQYVQTVLDFKTDRFGVLLISTDNYLA